MQSGAAAHPATGALWHQRVQLQAWVREVGAGVVAPDGHNGGIIGAGGLQGVRGGQGVGRAGGMKWRAVVGGATGRKGGASLLQPVWGQGKELAARPQAKLDSEPQGSNQYALISRDALISGTSTRASPHLGGGVVGAQPAACGAGGVANLGRPLAPGALRWGEERGNEMQMVINGAGRGWEQ